MICGQTRRKCEASELRPICRVSVGKVGCSTQGSYYFSEVDSLREEPEFLDPGFLILWTPTTWIDCAAAAVTAATPGSDREIPPHKISARGWVAPAPSFRVAALSLLTDL